MEELRYLASVAFDYVLAKLGESAVKEATDTGSIGEAVFVVANTVLNYTKDLGKTLADVLGPTTTTSTTLPHPDGGCCVQNNGCPGETPNSCANTAGCCCCPEGQTCCADHALGCCG